MPDERAALIGVAVFLIAVTVIAISLLTEPWGQIILYGAWGIGLSIYLLRYTDIGKRK